MTTAKDCPIRWAVFHGPDDEPRWTAPFRQGRYTYATQSEAEDHIRNMLANTSADTLRQIHGEGAIGTYRAMRIRCWPGHFDPAPFPVDDD